MRAALALLALAACDVEHTPAPWLACVDEVCEVLPACPPVVPSVVGSWDWRTRASCRRTMTCGDRYEVCAEAVSALPCIGPGPPPELREAHIRGVRAVQRACAWSSPASPPGDGAGGGVAVAWDKGAR